MLSVAFEIFGTLGTATGICLLAYAAYLKFSSRRKWQVWLTGLPGAMLCLAGLAMYTAVRQGIV